MLNLVKHLTGGRGHRLRVMPVLTLMAHGRCNCRCVMCDIWKANRAGETLTDAAIAAHLGDMKRLGVRHVVLSGGEALMHPNLWRLCGMLKSLPAKITLLSTGLLLERHAAEVVTHCDEVIVSLDGGPATHDRIRNIPGAYESLAAGVAALGRAQAQAQAGYPVSARCVVQRHNFRDLDKVVEAGRELGLDRVSFLAADVSSEAFNRPDGWDGERVAEVALSAAEVEEFGEVVESLIESRRGDFDSGFIAEPPDRLRGLVAYFQALNQGAGPPPVRCNAPWVSAVIEADGQVRPCFFHKSFGSIHQMGLFDIINSPAAIAFREGLEVATNPVCRTCVCTLYLKPGS